MVNIMDFGAVGDGSAKDTSAIQKAIDAGGIVYFPAGTYLSGTLYLKSNGGIELGPGAVLLASPDKEDYNADDFCIQNRVFTQEKVSGAHFIVAVEQHDIVIRGPGRIDGNRASFYKGYTPPNRDFHITGWRPAQMIFLCECSNVRISEAQLYNAPYWTCFLHGCEDVIISGLRILNDQRTPNGDGIDIDCCQRVTVTGCIIDSGDDCITLRGYDEPLKNKRPCEYVTVTNCVLRTCCNAFRIGVGNGIVRNCVISNCVIHDTRTAICIVSNYLSLAGSGVQIENISFSNIRIDADRALVILSDVLGTRDTPAGKEIRNIRFSGMSGTVSDSVLIAGNIGGGISGISFDHVGLDFIGCKNKIDDSQGAVYSEWNGRVPPGLFYIAHAGDVSLDHVRITMKPELPWSYSVQAVDVKDLEFDHCRFSMPLSADGKVFSLPE